MLCSGRIGNILRIFLSSLGVLLQFKQQLEYPSACNAHTSDIENIPTSIQCWYRSPAVSKAIRAVQRMRRRSEERRVGKECVSTCRSRGSTYESKNKQTKRPNASQAEEDNE